ncbi:MAG: hypothetical protein Q9225_003009 [Loekoesia sp. 1 TL-2023]
MSKKGVTDVKKSLPPTPRSHEKHDFVPSNAPEVYVHESLYPRSVSPTFPEVPISQGLERAFEGLECDPAGHDPPTSPVEDEAMPSHKRKKRCVLGIIVAIVVTIALGVGLGEITAEGQAYHGYWQQNLYALNTQFGSIDDLQALSAALHARDMYLMIDVVVNHYGWAGKSTTVDYQKFLPFNDAKYFHPYCPITQGDYLSNQTAVEKVSTTIDYCILKNNKGSSAGLVMSEIDFIVSLPDVNNTEPFVRQTYNSWIGSLTSVFAVDGLRVDTVKHVEKSFWPGFRSASGIYSLGEVFDGDVNYTCAYQEQLDGLLNYPLYYSLIEAFRDPDANMTLLSLAMTAIQKACRDPTLLGTFSENHDNPRFLSHANDMHLNKNIIAFTLLAGGIPIIYQGQEQGFSGGNDPSNREALWTSSYSTQTTLYRFIASINQLRNHDVYASPEYLTTPVSIIYCDDHNIALRKGLIVSLFSNMGSKARTYNLTLTDHGFPENEVVVEILTCRNSTVAVGGLQVSVQQGMPQVSRCESEFIPWLTSCRFSIRQQR